MSIQKRTIYYDVKNGNAMFLDWAKVTTTLGTMVEPFCVNQRHVHQTPFVNYDPEDEINRIDEIREMPAGKEQILLSGDDAGYHLMGGTHQPHGATR